MTEWTDPDGRIHRNYHWFEGKIGTYKGRQYKPVEFNSSGYLDINADDGTTVRISNRGIIRQIIYAGPAGGGPNTGQQNLNLAAGFVDSSIPFGRRLREAAFGRMGIDTNAPEYQNAAIISEGVSVGVTVITAGGVRIAGCLVETTTVPTRIYSARVLLRSADDTGPFHNFPESFNAEIFNGSRKVQTDFFKVDKQGLSNDSILYTAPGSINGRTGTFEIGVRPSVSGRTEVIMHRFFRPDRTP